MDSDMKEAIIRQAVCEACESFTDNVSDPDNTIEAITCGVKHAIQLMVHRKL